MVYCLEFGIISGITNACTMYNIIDYSQILYYSTVLQK